MKGIIGKKIGMTSIYMEDGTNVACTVVEAGPCVITQIKTEDTDGYNAVQLGFDEKKEKNTSRGELGHFKKAGVAPKRKIVEFRDFTLEKSIGDELTVDIFEKGEAVNIIGTSKGKGFQGVVKRHGFSGVGMRTHGQHNRMRAPGSVGASSFPSKVFKGMRMAGRMGNDRVKVKNLLVMEVMPERNIILIEGSIPGAKGSYLIIEK